MQYYTFQNLLLSDLEYEEIINKVKNSEKFKEAFQNRTVLTNFPLKYIILCLYFLLIIMFIILETWGGIKLFEKLHILG